MGIRTIKTAYAVGLMAGALSLSATRPAAACGGGGVTSSNGVVMNAQRVFVSARSSGTTDLIVQIAVPKTTADYGVLIPVPGEPTLDPKAVSSEDLDALDELTAPRILIADDSDSGSGCACLPVAGSDKGGSAPTRGVTASPPVQIGPVTAVSLTGTSPDAVSAWLTDNGFALPESEMDTLADYVGAGKYFIALRRSEHAASGGPSSVGIHYSLVGDHRQLSLAFTRIGAAPSVAFTLFLATTETVGPAAPFAALTLNDLDAALLKADDYEGAVRAAVASHDSKAFVLESSTAASSLVDDVPGLAPFLDADAVVTRATTILDRAELTDDAYFTKPFTKTVHKERYAALHPERMQRASLAFVGGVLLVGGLRRRLRIS